MHAHIIYTDTRSPQTLEPTLPIRLAYIVTLHSGMQYDQQNKDIARIDCASLCCVRSLKVLKLAYAPLVVGGTRLEYKHVYVNIYLSIYSNRASCSGYHILIPQSTGSVATDSLAVV